jgi:hypothetical protein
MAARSRRVPWPRLDQGTLTAVTARITSCGEVTKPSCFGSEVTEGRAPTYTHATPNAHDPSPDFPRGELSEEREPPDAPPSYIGSRKPSAPFLGRISYDFQLCGYPISISTAGTVTAQNVADAITEQTGGRFEGFVTPEGAVSWRDRAEPPFATEPTPLE